MIFLSDTYPNFPDPYDYDPPGGLMAAGGRLDIDYVWEAYQQGIFPWFNPDEEILWWCPDPRFVLFPSEIRISKSMRKIFRDEVFQFTENSCFEEVIRSCQEIERPEQDGTWITEDIINTFLELNLQGKAKSVEVWYEGELVGGFYGLTVGRVFCGESMFSKMSNASKAGFIQFVVQNKNVFDLIDCQIHSNHLESLGARSIPKLEFLEYLHNKKDLK